MLRKKLDADIEVLTDGPNCPICHATIKLVAAVRITDADVQVGGRDGLKNSAMSANFKYEVVNVSADHNCVPGI